MLEKWSTTAGSNVNANTGINWDEGMPPSAVNDSARSTMAELRDWYEQPEWPIYGRNGGSAYSISFVSTTVFKFAGTDRRTLVPAGRRVKAGVGAGVIYGTCTDVTLSASDTQATVAWDSGVLDSSLSYVALGVLNSTNNSYPRNMDMSFSDVTVAGTLTLQGGTFLGFISGLTYANDTSDATNDISIAPGVAMDSTGAYMMRLGSTLLKKSDASWAVGNDAGGLLSGAAANVDHYIWEIYRADTKVVDIGFETTANATPTLPASYTHYRLVGWFKRSGGAVVAFHTYETEGGGIEFNWDVPTLDINLANTLTTSRRTDAVRVPLNFSVEAHLNVALTDASSTAAVWICCPDQTDAAPSFTAAPLANQSSPAIQVPSQIKVRTSSTGTIASRATVATVDLYAVSTIGFRWARRG